jgi:predicted Co/Zn/Cd cation transporter (cation efflux family)
MTTISTSSSTAQDSAVAAPRRRWRAGVVVAAVLLALLTWLVANLIDASPIQVRMQDEVVGITGVSVLMTSVLAALAGWALLALLERLSPAGRRIWTAIAVVVLLLSLIAPLSYGIGAASKWSLVALHVVTGLVLIAGLPRSRARS